MMSHNYQEKGGDEVNNNVVEQQMVTEDTYGDGDDKDEEDKETDEEDKGNKMEIQGVDEDTRTMDKIPGVGYILQGGHSQSYNHHSNATELVVEQKANGKNAGFAQENDVPAETLQMSMKK